MIEMEYQYPKVRDVTNLTKTKKLIQHQFLYPIFDSDKSDVLQ